MDFFNFFPSLEKSNEAYFGQSSPLAQDLLTYADKLKKTIGNVDNTKFKDKAFMKQVNSILTDFGEAIKLDINAEKVTFLLVPNDMENASAIPIFIRADSTVTANGYKYLNLDKIADIEDIIVTTEGYKYRNKKNKLICINIFKGLIQKYEPEIIAGVLAHELGHCFQDGIFGVYKDVADMTYVNLQETGANLVQLTRDRLPKFFRGLTKVAGFRLIFIILTYLLHPGYLITSGIFSGLGVKLHKMFYNPIDDDTKNKTFKMKDKLKAIDNGDTEVKTQVYNNVATSVLITVNKDNDRDKFIKELKESNKEEWKLYLENSKNLEPIKEETINGWKKLVKIMDNLDIRIVKLLTLSRFTRKTYAKSSFYKRWEFFADIFAASYGFGPETYTFLSNVADNDLKDLNPVGLYWKYHIYKVYIEDSEYDVHGTNKQRLQNMYTDLQHELQTNTELTTEQKKQLQTQIAQLKKIADVSYENRKSEGNSIIVKAYNRLIDDRINGVNHDTEEKILQPIDDLCKEVCVGKNKKEIAKSIESLYI